MLDLASCRLVEHPEQAAGVLAGLESRPSQGRHARGGSRPRHGPREPPCPAQAHPLGLGNDGELVLLVGGDLDDATEPILEGQDLGRPLGQLSLKLADPDFGGGAVDGLDDLLGLAVERLPRLITVLGHRGDLATSSAQDGEGAGDALRDRGHGGLVSSRPTKGSSPRLHTSRRELSTHDTHQTPGLRKSRNLWLCLKSG